MNNLKLRLNIRMLKCLNIKMAEKGVSIYLALMIMFILLAIGLGISLIIVSQMKMIRGMGDSVVAFYAADTGIEHSLYNLRIQNGDGNVSGSVGDANYQVTSPTAGTYKSKGSFAKAKRAIEINIPLPPVAFDFSLTAIVPCGTGDSPTFLCLSTPPPSTQTYTTIKVTLISGTAEDVTFSVDPLSLPPDVSVGWVSSNSCTAAELTAGCTRGLYFFYNGTVDFSDTPITVSAEATSLTEHIDIHLRAQAHCDLCSW